jgi:nucleoid DNA-binding protein
MVERLSEHIEKLLAYHEYVVVPQLGGFVLQKQQAQISTVNIQPPRTTIAFNPLMKHADGLLAIEIARSEGITFRRANEIIHEEVEKVLKLLFDGQNCFIGKLGSLVKDATGNFQFEPAANADFLPGNLALAELHVSQKKELSKADNERIVITLPRASTLRNVAAAVLILILAGISQQVNDVRKTEFADLMSIEFVKIPEVTVTPDPCPELEIVEEAGAEVVANDTELNHVIVASLPTKEMADSYCEVLKSQNYECAHVLEPVKTYRVVIQSFHEKNEAIEFMEKLRKTNEQFSSAWVLCRH